MNCAKPPARSTASCKRIIIFAALSLVLAGWAPKSAASGAPADAASCIEKNETGVIWRGDPDASLVEAALALQDFASAHAESAAGVSYCTNYDGVILYAKKNSSQAVEFVSKLRLQFPSYSFFMEEVPSSYAELAAAQESARLELVATATDAALQSDISTGSLSIDAFDERDLPRIRKVEKRIETSHRIEVEARVNRMKKGIRASSLSDISPWTMGAALWNASGGRCSAGLLVKIGTRQILVTAGHCGNGPFHNTGYVGDTFTTAYPGNAVTLGDWQMLYRGNYSHYVYTGALGSDTKKRITAIRWDVLPQGSGMCTSGSTTGSICRYKVLSTGVQYTFQDGPAGHLTLMSHDSSGGNLRDANGFRKGDSGGLCFYSDGQGGVVANGLVEGYSSIWGGMGYYCTDLKGVKAHAPTAVLN